MDDSRQQWRGTRLGCLALDLDYPEISQCFNPRGVTDVPPRLKSFRNGHRLNHTFALPRKFSVSRVKRKPSCLPEPHIRSIVERKVPCVRQRRDLRCIKIHHALHDQIFRCRQKSIHQILGHPATSDLFQQHMSEFIPPENGSNPLRVQFQKAPNRILHLRISDEKIRHHCAIDNYHGKNLPSPLTRSKIFFSNIAVKDKITSAPHQWQPVFLLRSTFFAAPSSRNLPMQSSERLDFFCFRRGFLQRVHSAPRSPLGSCSGGSSSPALSKPRAAHQAYFVSSMLAWLQSASMMQSNQLLSS